MATTPERPARPGPRRRRGAVPLAAAAVPGLAVADRGLARLPHPETGPDGVGPARPGDGGLALDRALDGLAASRGAAAAAGGPPPPRTTRGRAQLRHRGRPGTRPGRPGRSWPPTRWSCWAAPGCAGGRRRRPGGPEVYGAWSLADPVSWLGGSGRRPWTRSFGDTAAAHRRSPSCTPTYYDRPADLTAIGEVVAGTAPVSGHPGPRGSAASPVGATAGPDPLAAGTLAGRWPTVASPTGQLRCPVCARHRPHLQHHRQEFPVPTKTAKPAAQADTGAP